ncbi:MAG: DNA-binding protein YbaB [Bacteroidia bacterium]
MAIDDALIKEDKAMLEDLIAAAVNDAVRRVEETNKNALGKMFSGAGMPSDFKMPF